MQIETVLLVTREKLKIAILANAELEALIIELKEKLAKYESEGK